MAILDEKARGRRWRTRHFVGVVLLAAFAVGALATVLSTSPSRIAEARPQKKGPQPTRVHAELVTDTDLEISRSWLGEVRAMAAAEIAAAEPGRVRRVLVREGARVRAGQVLVEFDDTRARADLGRAKAEWKTLQVESEHAKVEASRFSALAEEQVAPALEADQRRAKAAALAAQGKSLESAVEAHTETVRRHRLVAPFGGVVAARYADPGDWLNPGQRAIELVDDSGVEVLVRVDASLAQAPDSVTSVSIGEGDQRVAAQIVGRVASLDRRTRTALVRVVPSARPPWLLAGAATSVSFTIKVGGGVVVPRDALVLGVAGKRVFVVQGAEARMVGVEVVAESPTLALVKGEGLAAGARVVVRGNERLRPGAHITLEGVTLPEGK